MKFINPKSGVNVLLMNKKGTETCDPQVAEMSATRGQVIVSNGVEIVSMDWMAVSRRSIAICEELCTKI
jgi:hypothetical protein